MIDDPGSFSGIEISASPALGPEANHLISIAKSCLVSSMTVSRVINQAASDVGQSSFDALPEHLMMDEFKSVKNVIGKMSFIYADAVSHRIVDVVADRKLKSLKDHFIAIL